MLLGSSRPYPWSIFEESGRWNDDDDNDDDDDVGWVQILDYQFIIIIIIYLLFIY